MMDRGYAYSMSGGAGGQGTRISTVTYGARIGSFGPGYDHQSSFCGSTSGTLNITSKKTTMQNLNGRLESYLETVRTLEKTNTKLQIKIRECIEKKGPKEGKDFSKYNATLADLRSKRVVRGILFNLNSTLQLSVHQSKNVLWIFNMIKGNAQLAISLDNARLASDDFKAKMENEMIMRQVVEADVSRMRKLLDDTNIIRLHLESDIESLKEELINLRKNHMRDVAELQAQITSVSVNVDVDAPKGQDLARVMEEMRAKYEKIVLKNQEELKVWHETQITEVQVQVSESSTALKEANSVLTETRRRCQAMEIELQSSLSLKTSLEATLWDIQVQYNMEVEKYNVIILRLQEEVTRIRSDIQQNSREYEQLLNIKIKLVAEIAEYRRLLDGEGDFRPDDAVDSKQVQTKVVTVTQTLVDGKVVSESKDIKSNEKLVS